MPNQITRNFYECVYCKQSFTDEDLAKQHETKEHDILYVPIERSDLNGLLNFIVTNDNNQAILTARLLETLYRYTRA
jgi:hypothetical protein